MLFKIKRFSELYKKNENKKSNSQYKLLSVFEYQNEIYALRINKKSLESINLKTQKIIKIKPNQSFDIKKANEWQENKNIQNQCRGFNFEF